MCLFVTHQVTSEDLTSVAEDVSKARRLVWEDNDVTVIDTVVHSSGADLAETPALGLESEEEGVTRSLYLNDRPGLVQTSIHLSSDDVAAIEARIKGHHEPNVCVAQLGVFPSPLVGEHHQGLAIGAALAKFLSSGIKGGGAAGGLRVAVLGAGGCALPTYLAKLPFFAHVTAVESSKAVVKAAAAYFITASPKLCATSDSDQVDYEYPGNTLLQIVNRRAEEWLLTVADGYFDLLIIDIEDGETNANSLVAPPAWCLDPNFLKLCSSKLNASGVLGMNLIGAPGDFSSAFSRVAESGLPFVYRADRPPKDTGSSREAALFAHQCADFADLCGSDLLRSSFDALDSPVVENLEGWVGGFRCVLK